MSLVPAERSGNVVPFPKPPKLERAEGDLRLDFARRGAATAVAELFQSGCAKVRFPAAESSGLREAVLLNTAGGLTDGDRLKNLVTWGPDTRAVVTTQAAEKIYRSRQAAARIETRLVVGAEALALWLPQETILFDGARLKRRATVELDPAGRMLACESLIFGRAAMGETVRSGEVLESWRVRLGGHLVFADDFRLGGNMAAMLDRPAVAGGGRAIATLLYVGADAAARVAALREAGAAARMGEPAVVASSCLDQVLVARVLARGGLDLRRALAEALNALLQGLGEGGAPLALPRVWTS